MDSKNNIEIDPGVESFIKEHGVDFRLCTTCGGPMLVPIDFKSPKPSDIKFKVGDNILYVSKVQARYLRKIDISMLDYYFGSQKKNDKF